MSSTDRQNTATVKSVAAWWIAAAASIAGAGLGGGGVTYAKLLKKGR